MTDLSVHSPYGESAFGQPWSSYDNTPPTSALSLRTTMEAESDAIGIVTVKWLTPGGTYDRLALSRSFYGSPVHPEEGIIVLDWDPAAQTIVSFTDSAAAGNAFAYYTLFARTTDAEPRWVVSASVEALFIQDMGGFDLLWENIPEIFRTMDEEHNTGSGGPLRRYVQLLSLELDRNRTIQDYGLRNVNALDKVPASKLPDVSTKLSSNFELAVGEIRLRESLLRLLGLRKVKGTSASIEGLTTALTGWESTAVPGTNILPLRDDGDFVASIGNWVAQQQATLLFDTGVTPGAVSGGGYLRVTCSGAAPQLRLGAEADAKTLGIRVTAGVAYTLSAYGIAGTGLSATWALGLRWYDAAGAFLSASAMTPAAITDAGYTRISGTLTAPASAVFAIVTLESADALDTEVYYFDQIMAEESGTVSDYEPPRKVWIYVSPTRTNRAIRPSFENATLGITVAGTTTAVRSDEQARSGTYSAKVTIGDSNVVTMGSYTAPANRQFSYSVYAYNAAAATRLAFISLVWKDALNATISTSVGATRTLGPGVWARPRVMATAPANATSVDVVITFSSSLATEVIYLDDQLAEDTLALNPHFDGNTHGGGGGYYNEFLWRGAADGSESVFYMDRDIRLGALNVRLADFVPHSADFQVVFSDAP